MRIVYPDDLVFDVLPTGSGRGFRWREEGDDQQWSDVYPDAASAIIDAVATISRRRYAETRLLAFAFAKRA